MPRELNVHICSNRTCYCPGFAAASRLAGLDCTIHLRFVPLDSIDVEFYADWQLPPHMLDELEPDPSVGLKSRNNRYA
jgi:hypothetical protein